MLLASTIAFGSIVSDGDWSDFSGGGGSAGGDEESSGAYSLANSTNPSGWACATGWQSLQTTELAECNWSCYVYHYVSVEATAVGQASVYAEAWASVYASAGGFGNASLDDVGVDVNDTGSDWDGDLSDYNSGTDDFPANTGCGSNHEVGVMTEVDSGTGSTAYGHACATARVTMSLN